MLLRNTRLRNLLYLRRLSERLLFFANLMGRYFLFNWQYLPHNQIRYSKCIGTNNSAYLVLHTSN